MSEQIREEAHDRIDLLQLRVSDLEKLAETQNKMMELLSQGIRNNTKNIDTVISLLKEISNDRN